MKKKSTEEKIELVLGAISKEEKKIRIDPSYIGTGPGIGSIKRGSSIVDTQNGIEVDSIRLESLVNSRKIDDAILKVDCEGCEYDVILNSKKEVSNETSFLF